MNQLSEEARQVLEANIALHSAMATRYDEEQPHFRAENIARVEQRIADIARQTSGEVLLDLGTGTGFVLNIAKKYFRRVIGVDVTAPMLKLVDLSDDNTQIVMAETGQLPLPDNAVDACTAYSFLHHLYDLLPTLNESLRCLKPGGVFYAEQDPNYHFWEMINGVQQRPGLPDIIQREVDAIVHVAHDIAGNYDVTPQDVAMAEYYKVVKGGFDGDALIESMQNVGFGDVDCRYEWFLGQGKAMHEQSEEVAAIIEGYLRNGLPATRYLFKYIAMTARKPDAA